MHLRRERVVFFLAEIAADDAKGCYPGQEVVARVSTYGGLQRKITGLLFEKSMLPSRGNKIVAAGKEIGQISSACLSPTLDKGIAIGIVQKGYFEKPCEVVIKADAGDIRATTTQLPF